MSKSNLNISIKNKSIQDPTVICGHREAYLFIYLFNYLIN